MPEIVPAERIICHVADISTAALVELPEDAEQIKAIIELDNPGYELIRVEKKYCEEEGNWHFFCRMQLLSRFIFDFSS